MSDRWYHGSPHRLDALAPGSTITRERHLAEVFSHKPRLVSLEDDGRILHDGLAPGYLYLIGEPVGLSDVAPHPRSTMPRGLEWITGRPLRLVCLGPTSLTAEERLTEDEARELSERYVRWRDSGR